MFFGPRQFVPALLFLLIPVVAFAGIPHIENCNIYTRATQDVSVFVCPACDGYDFSAAQTLGGGLMDATIEVYIRDIFGLPVENVPASDITIDDPNLCWCVPDGNIADFNTDPNGYTEFAMAPCGGGCSENFELGGYLTGMPFLQNPLPYIKVNSPDLNCDLVVNLTDLALFANGYFGPYTYCVDYYWDGVVNLLDLAEFAQHYGHLCP
jgi:hypothetical protein